MEDRTQGSYWRSMRDILSNAVIGAHSRLQATLVFLTDVEIGHTLPHVEHVGICWGHFNTRLEVLFHDGNGMRSIPAVI